MESSLSKLILALLAIAIILLFVINFIPFLGDSGSKTACKNWANMQSRTKIAGIKIPVIFDSPCITFSDKIKDKTKINKQLAEAMYDCWDMYGEGKVDFFSDWDSWLSDTYCIVCNEIEVDKKIDTTLDIDDFEEYLSNHNPPFHEETYAGYFLGPDHSSIDFGSGTINIKKEEPLYILFTINKHREPMKFGGSDMVLAGSFCVAGAQAAAGVGAIITFFAGGVGAIPGAAAGCGIGLLSGVVVSFTSHADVLYPSIFLASGKDVLEKGCDDYYYKPQGTNNLGGII